jgi:hypothetical protein
LSTPKAADLEFLNISTYYYEMAEEEVKVQFFVEKPKLNRDTPSPTLLFQLPQRYHFEVVL